MWLMGSNQLINAKRLDADKNTNDNIIILLKRFKVVELLIRAPGVWSDNLFYWFIRSHKATFKIKYFSIPIIYFKKHDNKNKFMCVILMISLINPRGYKSTAEHNLKPCPTNKRLSPAEPAHSLGEPPIFPNLHPGVQMSYFSFQAVQHPKKERN